MSRALTPMLREAISDKQYSLLQESEELEETEKMMACAVDQLYAMSMPQEVLDFGEANPGLLPVRKVLCDQAPDGNRGEYYTSIPLTMTKARPVWPQHEHGLYTDIPRSVRAAWRDKSTSLGAVADHVCIMREAIMGSIPASEEVNRSAWGEKPWQRAGRHLNRAVEAFEALLKECKTVEELLSALPEAAAAIPEDYCADEKMHLPAAPNEMMRKLLADVCTEEAA